MASTTNVVLLVIAGIFLVLYLMRRRSRLRSDD
jgi:hypothetical protein